MFSFDTKSGTFNHHTCVRWIQIEISYVNSLVSNSIFHVIASWLAASVWMSLDFDHLNVFLWFTWDKIPNVRACGCACFFRLACGNLGRLTSWRVKCFKKTHPRVNKANEKCFTWTRASLCYAIQTVNESFKILYYEITHIFNHVFIWKSPQFVISF